MSDTSPRKQSERASDSDIYQLLSSSRRRQIIWSLAVADTWKMPLRHIASHVAAFDKNESAVEVPRSDVTEMYHSLKRHHLGPLVALDVLTLQEQETISPGPQFFAILPVLVRSQAWEYEQQTN